MEDNISRKDGIIAYMAFDGDFKCKGFQYEVGKEYHAYHGMAMSDKGFCACERLVDLFHLFPMVESRYAKAIVYGKVIQPYDSKVLYSSDIEIIRKMSLDEAMNDYLSVEKGFKRNCNDDIRITKYKSESFIDGKQNKIVSTGNYNLIVIKGIENGVVSAGINSKVMSCCDNANIDIVGNGSRIVSIGDMDNINISGFNEIGSFGKYNVINVCGSANKILSRGNHTSINLLSALSTCMSNGDNDVIRSTGNNMVETNGNDVTIYASTNDIIKSNGDNARILMDGDNIAFKAKENTRIVIANKGELVVGKDEIKENILYILKKNEIKIK